MHMDGQDGGQASPPGPLSNIWRGGGGPGPGTRPGPGGHAWAWIAAPYWSTGHAFAGMTEGGTGEGEG